ncbi:unnamed protein product [Camellia sinensis]
MIEKRLASGQVKALIEEAQDKLKLIAKMFLVMCDAYTPAGEPIPTNKRYNAEKIFSHPDVVAEEPRYGIEQEYTLLQKDVKWPIGWPKGGYPRPQRTILLWAGADKGFGRDVVDSHYKVCLYAGINTSGINGEVMPGQTMSMTADLDETLLIGSSSFPYFMLVTVEVIPLETTTSQSLHCSPDKKVASPHQSLLSRLFVSRETSFLIGNPEKMEKVKKGAGGRKVGGPKKKLVSQSVKAGLQFPVGRIGRYLKKGRYSQHVGTGAPVYLAAVLEYLAAEN